MKKALAILMATFATTAVWACSDDDVVDDVEDAGEEVDDAAEDATDAVGDAGEDAIDAGEEGVDVVDDAGEDAVDAAGDAGEDVGDVADEAEDEVAQRVNCDQICSVYAECVAEIDESSCLEQCEDRADADQQVAELADACEDCLDGKSCAEIEDVGCFDTCPVVPVAE